MVTYILLEDSQLVCYHGGIRSMATEEIKMPQPSSLGSAIKVFLPKDTKPLPDHIVAQLLQVVKK
jgi:hypothetical protein